MQPFPYQECKQCPNFRGAIDQCHNLACHFMVLNAMSGLMNWLSVWMSPPIKGLGGNGSCRRMPMARATTLASVTSVQLSLMAIVWATSRMTDGFVDAKHPSRCRAGVRSARAPWISLAWCPPARPSSTPCNCSSQADPATLGQTHPTLCLWQSALQRAPEHAALTAEPITGILYQLANLHCSHGMCWQKMISCTTAAGTVVQIQPT